VPSVAVPPAQRFHYLDTVRGLAALSVVASHYVNAYGAPSGDSLLDHLPLFLLWDGFAAVCLFFVLSGLVLSLRFFRDTPTPDLRQLNLLDFGVRRVARIWPPYLAALVLSLVLRELTYRALPTDPAPSPWALSHWSPPMPPLELLREAWLLNPGHLDLIPQGWTLSLEMTLSMLVPAAVLLAGRGNVWLLGSTAIAIWPLGLQPFAFHFVIGVLIAKHYQTMLGWARHRRGLALAALLLGIALYSFRYTVPPRLGLGTEAGWINYVVGLGAALLLAYVIGTDGVRAALSHRWLVHIGRVSYSVYLLHIAVLLGVTPWALAAYGALVPGSGWLAGLLFTIAATLLLSTLSYRLVELPSIALGRWAARRSVALADRLTLAAERVRRALATPSPERPAASSGLSRPTPAADTPLA
jgi:peptidoglycan/LPS O-acetylase OafA/YrhL